MKKTILVLIPIIAILLVAGIFAASAYSTFDHSGTQNKLGSQIATTQPLTSTTSSRDSTTTSLASTTTSIATVSSTSIASSTQTTHSSTSTTSSYVMMPWYNSYYSIQTVSINDSMNALNSPPSYARIFSNNDTISFSGSQITIVAVGMMPGDASNMTGMNPPKYATDDVFVIYGLIDPTLVIPSASHVNLVFVNLDDDMYHNFVVTSLAPPYSYMPMQGMMYSNSSSWYGGMGGGMMGEGSTSTIFAMMMPVLAPANYTNGTAYSYATTFTLNSYGGSYWYICTYPGHAQSGMYGKIVVSG